MSLDRLPSLLAVLDLVRRSHGISTTDVAERLGLGRSLVTQRTAQLERAGLVDAVGRAPSTGGRAPRLLVHRAVPGALVAGVDIGAREVVVLLAGTDGEPVEAVRAPAGLHRPPTAVLDDVADRVRDTVARHAGVLRAVGLGLPAPVDVVTGRPVSPPVLPAWDGVPVREHLAAALGVPVDVDNDVNLRLLAELRRPGPASASRHALLLHVAQGVGAAIAVDGAVYRGANGAAGDLGHVPAPAGGMALCRCGNLGCLEAVAGVEAFVRDGTVLAESGHSPALAVVLAERGEVRALDITEAAEAGDPAAAALYARVAALLGDSLSGLVSILNPHLVVLSGAFVRGRALLLEPVEHAVRTRALPLTTRDLVVAVTDLEDGAARGACELALDRLFTREHAGSLLPS